MTIEQFLFALFALLTCGGAISVVICQNVVRMAFSLIISLASISALFFLLGADFVGATQLMVYVGGTIVLLIFGVMLTSSSTLMQIRTSPAEGFLAAGIGVLFLSVFSFTVWSVDWDRNEAKLAGVTAVKGVAPQGYNEASSGNTVRPLAMSFVGLRPDKAGQAPGYLLPFEIVSVHLLVVLIGAAYLARPKRRVAVEELSGTAVELNTATPTDPCGRTARFGAAFVDGLLVYVVTFIVELLMATPLGFLSQIALYVALPWLYFSLMESSALQATFGKSYCGLIVCDLDGKRIGFIQATIRYFAKILSGALLLIGYLMILFTKRARGLHDVLAKTLVVRQ